VVSGISGFEREDSEVVPKARCGSKGCVLFEASAEVADNPTGKIADTKADPHFQCGLIEKRKTDKKEERRPRKKGKRVSHAERAVEDPAESYLKVTQRGFLDFAGNYGDGYGKRIFTNTNKNG